MSPPARVLVVANRTADSEELRAVLLERFERGPIELTLLAPAAWEVTDPHGGTESARRRLRAAMARLGADGIAVRTLVGDANPVIAVEQIWEAECFDEVIVSTLPAQPLALVGHRPAAPRRTDHRAPRPPRDRGRAGRGRREVGPRRVRKHPAAEPVGSADLASVRARPPSRPFVW